LIARDRRHQEPSTLMIPDLTLRTLQASLWGLSARRSAAEQDLANVETPGYRAGVVSFEDSLRSAVESGRPSDVDISTSASGAATGVNGNNVDVADEMVGLTETALRQQLVVEALNGKYATMRTAIGS
jgi:flagellar basal-body rod protein FlgB